MICCEGCVFDFGWKPGDTSVPYECMCCKIINGKPTNFKPKPKTNADRIRAMTDEELAKECVKQFPMYWWPTEVRAIYFAFDNHNKNNAKNAWLKWLQQPAEGDA